MFLLVVLEEVLRVLAGGEPQIERDRDFFALIVPVWHSDAFHSLFGEVEVGRQQFAVETEFFALAAGGKLFLPRSLLADGAFVHVVHRLVQFLALGAQALGAVLLGVVAFQHGIEGRPFLDKIFLAVLLWAEEGVLDGLAVRVSDAARTAALVVLFLQLIDGSHQAALLLLGQFVCDQMFAVKGAPCGLAADHRADAGHGLVQGIRHGKIPLAGRRHDGRGTHQQKIRSCRFGRGGIGQARQQLPDIAVLKIHPLERVDGLAVLHQHQIGVTPHQLGTQGVAHKVAHLVGALEVKIDDTVARLHVYIQQFSAGQMLAHQHAEGGRRLRVFKAFFGQAHPGRTAAGRQQQRIGVRAGAQGDDQLVAGRFKQFCDLGIGQGSFQFPGRQFQCRGIQCHVCYLVLL